MHMYQGKQTPMCTVVCVETYEAYSPKDLSTVVLHDPSLNRYVLFGTLRGLLHNVTNSNKFKTGYVKDYALQFPLY